VWVQVSEISSFINPPQRLGRQKLGGSGPSLSPIVRLQRATRAPSLCMGTDVPRLVKEMSTPQLLHDVEQKIGSKRPSITKPPAPFPKIGLLLEERLPCTNRDRESYGVLASFTSILDPQGFLNCQKRYWKKGGAYCGGAANGQPQGSKSRPMIWSKLRFTHFQARE